MQKQIWNLKLAFSKKAKRSNLGANIDQLIEMTKITSVHNVKHPKTCQKKGGKKHKVEKEWEQF